MKNFTKITACVVALGFALTLSSCSTPADTTSPTSQATSTPAAKTTEAVIAARFEEFLQAAYTIDSVKMKTFYSKYEAITATPTDDEKKALIASMLEVLPQLSYVDVEGLTLDQVGSVYGNILSSSSIANSSVLLIHVPKEAITVNGTNASVDIAKLEISVDGVPSTSNTTTSPNVTFSLKNGVWMINHADMNL